MKPITLMKLSETKDPDDIKDVDVKNLVVSKKYDGWLTQAIKSDGKWKIHSRRGQDKTQNIPRVVGALEKSGIPDGTFLLGEMVVKKDGKNDIGEVQSILGANPEKGAEKEKDADITFYVFDVLWRGGNKVADKSLKDRINILNSIVKDSEFVKKVPNKPFSNWQDVLNKAVKEGGEGIVLKDITKSYKYKPSLGQSEPKPGFWYKFKGGAGKSDSDDFVVYEHTVGEKGKDKFKFGQYYKGKLYGISEISNLSKEDADSLKKQLDAGKRPVIEIGFQERQPGGLRHQKFLRTRVDKSAKNATMSEIHSKNIDNFEEVKRSQDASDMDVRKLRNLVSPQLEDLGDNWRFRFFIGNIPITEAEHFPKNQMGNFHEALENIVETNFFDLADGHYDDEIMQAYEKLPQLRKLVNPISKNADSTIVDTGFGNMIYNYSDDEDYIRIGHGKKFEVWALYKGKIYYDSEQDHKDLFSAMGLTPEEVRSIEYSGRIDHDKKKISISSRWYSTGKNVDKVAKILSDKYPDYEILFFGRVGDSPIPIEKYLKESNAEVAPITYGNVGHGEDDYAYVIYPNGKYEQWKPYDYDPTAGRGHDPSDEKNAMIKGRVDDSREWITITETDRLMGLRENVRNRWVENAYKILAKKHPGYKIFYAHNMGQLMSVEEYLVSEQFIKDASEISPMYLAIGHEEDSQPFSFYNGRLHLLSYDDLRKKVHQEIHENVGVINGRIDNGLKVISLRGTVGNPNPTEDQIRIVSNLLYKKFTDYDQLFFPKFGPAVSVDEYLQEQQNVSDAPLTPTPAVHDPMSNTEEMEFHFTMCNDEDYRYIQYEKAFSYKDGILKIGNSEFFDDNGFVGKITKDKILIKPACLDVDNKIQAEKVINALLDKLPNHKIFYLKQKKANKDFEEKEHDWSEVLIDKEKKLTRGQIRDHYNKVKSKLFKYVKDRKVVIYLGIGKNENVLKRNENDKPIVIKSIEGDTSSALNYWIKRRMIEIHPTIESSDDVIWVDLDLHGNYSFSDVKKYADKISKLMKKEFGGNVQKWFSGGTGIHVVGYLKNKVDINDARNKLKDTMNELSESDDQVSTGIIKGDGLRLDVTTLKNTGSIRAPHSLSLSTGKDKKLLGEEKMASISKKAQNDFEAMGQEELVRIIFDEKSWPSRRERAVRSLKDQSVLEKLVIEDKDPHIRLEAIKKVLNPDVIDRVALNDDDKYVRLEAVKKTQNQEAIIQIAHFDKDDDVRAEATRKIEDQKILKEMAARRHANWEDRVVAIEMIGDQKFLEQLATRDENARIRHVATKKLEDQNMLIKIAKNTKEVWPVRVAAIYKINDKEVLIDIRDNDDSEYIRKAAEARLKMIETFRKANKPISKKQIKEAQKRIFYAYDEDEGKYYLSLVMRSKFGKKLRKIDIDANSYEEMKNKATDAIGRFIKEVFLRAKIDPERRESRGVVYYSDADMNRTSLPNNVYLDIRSGAKSAGKPTGNDYVVYHMEQAIHEEKMTTEEKAKYDPVVTPHEYIKRKEIIRKNPARNINIDEMVLARKFVENTIGPDLK